MTAVKTLWGPAAIGNITAVASALGSVSLNDADNAAALILNVPQDGSITDVGFLLNSENGTSPAYNCGIVTLDANGRPTTTAYGGSAITSAQWTSAGWKWVTLSTPATANAGDFAAVHIYPGASAPDGTNYIATPTSGIAAGMGRNASYTTAWSVQTAGAGYAIKYGTGEVYGLALSTNTIHLSINSGTTPDEVGCLFQVPAAMTCRGARVFHNNSGLSSSTAIDVVLYDGSNSVLASVSLADKDLFDDVNDIDVSWDAVSLAAATNYRLIIKPTTTGPFYAQKWAFESTAALAAIPEGVRWQWTERTDAGPWTDTNTAVCPMGLYVTDITFSVVGGGGGGEFAYIG